MVRKCCVFACSETHDKKIFEKKRQGEKCTSTFTCPSKKLLPEWQRRIKRFNYTVTMKSPVCARHFHPEDILTHYETKMPDGSVDRIERGRPSLKKTAVPKLFDGPSYVSDQKKQRKSISVRKNLNTQNNDTKKAQSLRTEQSKSPSTSVQNIINDSTEENGIEVEELQIKSEQVGQEKDVQTEQVRYYLRQVMGERFTEENTIEVEELQIKSEQVGQEKDVQTDQEKQVYSVTALHSNPYIFKLPAFFWGVHSDEEKNTAFSYLNPTTSVEANKVVIFSDSLKARVILRTVEVEIPGMEVTQPEDINKLLARVHDLRLCKGYTDEDVRNPEYSPKCFVHIPATATSKTTRCFECIKYRASVKRRRAMKREYQD